MYLELVSNLTGRKKTIWGAFLDRLGLDAVSTPQQTALLWEGEQLIGTASRDGNLIKCIGVDPAFRGQDLTATLVTALRQEAFRVGEQHLFLYTKPENKALFAPLFFYPVAQADRVLLMESKRNGLQSFLSAISPNRTSAGTVGCAVMNCNPFTLGHRHLAEIAASECDQVYLFVLSEDKSRFSTADRLEMVRLGTQDLPGVTVLPTGPYLISSATFPTYFLKDREIAEMAHCMLDIEIFTHHFAPAFSITRRYVGTEETSPLTAKYNQALKNHLPEKGISVREIPRLCKGGTPVSAGQVRSLLDSGEQTKLRALLPQTTLDYLQAKGLITLS